MSYAKLAEINSQYIATVAQSKANSIAAQYQSPLGKVERGNIEGLGQALGFAYGVGKTYAGELANRANAEEVLKNLDVDYEKTNAFERTFGFDIPLVGDFLGGVEYGVELDGNKFDFDAGQLGQLSIGEGQGGIDILDEMNDARLKRIGDLNKGLNEALKPVGEFDVQNLIHTFGPNGKRKTEGEEVDYTFGNFGNTISGIPFEVGRF